MKVLFVPYYYYIQYLPFHALQQRMKEKGVSTKLLYIPEISAQDETQNFNPHRFKQDGFDHDLLRLNRYGKKSKWLRYPLEYLGYWFNYRMIKEYLIQNRPSVVLIGSHLGGIYIRVIQKLCAKLHIPLASYWTNCEFEENLKSYQGGVPTWLLRLLCVEDIFHWEPWNAYTERHLFLASQPAVSKQLNRLGATSNQVRLVGSPLYDQWVSLSTTSSPDVTKASQKKNLDPLKLNTVLIVTEVIQEVLGMDYLHQYAKQLARASQNLPLNTQLMIKFHPRETVETQDVYREAFSGQSCHFLIENQSPFEILHPCHFVIGMYSKFLEMALMANKPVLVFNPTQNPKYCFYQDVGDPWIASSEEELRESMHQFLCNAAHRSAVHQKISTWIDQHLAPRDGNNTERATMAILDHGKGATIF